MLAPVPPPATAPPVPRVLPSDAYPAVRWLARNPLLIAGVLLTAFFIAMALFAPWLAPHDPSQLNLLGRLHPPSSAALFGTDELGRDILSRILYGARISLSVGFAVVGLSLLLGVIVGAAAGFFGGPVDTLLNVYLANAFLALPGILLAIAFVAFMGPGLLQRHPCAVHLGLGQLRAPGPCPGDGRQAARVRRSRTLPGRSRLRACCCTHPAQHRPACLVQAIHRHGRRRSL